MLVCACVACTSNSKSQVGLRFPFPRNSRARAKKFTPRGISAVFPRYFAGFPCRSHKGTAKSPSRKSRLSRKNFPFRGNSAEFPAGITKQLPRRPSQWHPNNAASPTNNPIAIVAIKIHNIEKGASFYLFFSYRGVAIPRSWGFPCCCLLRAHCVFAAQLKKIELFTYESNRTAEQHSEFCGFLIWLCSLKVINY